MNIFKKIEMKKSYGDERGTWCQSSAHTADEYIEIKFSKEVYVTKVNIYETYHCGGVVRIKLKDKSQNNWKTVWKSEPENTPQNIETSRIFSPDLEKTLFKTNEVRLDVNCSVANSYCEIDAIGL